MLTITILQAPTKEDLDWKCAHVIDTIPKAYVTDVSRGVVPTPVGESHIALISYKPPTKPTKKRTPVKESNG